MVGGGDIINGKHDAGDTLKEKEKQAGTPQSEPPIDFWYFPI
jgi:hypothetical protein